MTLQARRLIVAVPLSELLAVLSMVMLGSVVFATLNATVTLRILEMQRLALLTAPITGFVFCLLGGWWVTRRTTADHVRNGVVLGLVVAAIDLGLLIASGAPVRVLMVTSAAARIAGGYCGGLLARKSAQVRGEEIGEAKQHRHLA